MPKPDFHFAIPNNTLHLLTALLVESCSNAITTADTMLRAEDTIYGNASSYIDIESEVEGAPDASYAPLLLNQFLYSHSHHF